MAKIEFKGITEYQKIIDELGKKNSSKMIRYAIYPAAKFVADQMKDSIPVSNDPRTQGDLYNGMVLTPMTDDGTGFVSTTLTFEGYDNKGAPLRLVARALESGRSTPSGKVGKHPFFRPTIRRTRKKAEQLMQFYVDRYINNFMNRK